MKRTKLPLWRWDPFLAGLVLVLSLVAALFQRLDIPVLSPIALTVLLVVAVAAAVLLVLPFFVPSLRRDGEGSLALDEHTNLVPLPTSDTFPVVDGQRHRASLEAALARGGSELTAVLVPGATAWLGRDIRVAVDVVAQGTLYRVGYLPREIDQQANAALRPLAQRGIYRTVPLGIRNVPNKPPAVTVELGPTLGTLPQQAD